MCHLTSDRQRQPLAYNGKLGNSYVMDLLLAYSLIRSVGKVTLFVNIINRYRTVTYI